MCNKEVLERLKVDVARNLEPAIASDIEFTVCADDFNYSTLSELKNFGRFHLRSGAHSVKQLIVDGGITSDVPNDDGLKVLYGA